MAGITAIGVVARIGAKIRASISNNLSKARNNHKPRKVAEAGARRLSKKRPIAAISNRSGAGAVGAKPLNSSSLPRNNSLNGAVAMNSAMMIAALRADIAPTANPAQSVAIVQIARLA